MKETRESKTVIVNPEYEYLRSYLETIPENFDSLGSLIDARRNITREDTVRETRLVIKSFKRIYLTNRIRYSFFYPSKAQRAYDNAKMLLQKGFTTPTPIAYIEVKRSGLISQSYFISEYTDFESLEKPEVKSTIDGRLLEELANYTFRLHQNNIYHVDFTLGNILIKKNNDHFEFSLIDNNRMRFQNISLALGIKNFIRLGLGDAQLAELARQYAKRWNANESRAVEQLFNFRAIKAHKNEIKGSLKRAWAGVKAMFRIHPKLAMIRFNDFSNINYLLISFVDQVQSNPLMFSDL